MFGLFKKKTEIDTLEDKYQILVREAYELSSQNRLLSDRKVAEANEVLQQIEMLKKEK